MTGQTIDLDQEKEKTVEDARKRKEKRSKDTNNKSEVEKKTQNTLKRLTLQRNLTGSSIKLNQLTIKSKYVKHLKSSKVSQISLKVQNIEEIKETSIDKNLKMNWLKLKQVAKY